MLSVLRIRALLLGYKLYLSTSFFEYDFLMLNHFNKQNAAFFVGHLCITVLLPSKKIMFKGNCETFAAVWMMKRICIRPENEEQV